MCGKQDKAKKPAPPNIDVDKRWTDEAAHAFLKTVGLRCVQDLNEPPLFTAGNYYTIPGPVASAGGDDRHPGTRNASPSPPNNPATAQSHLPTFEQLFPHARQEQLPIGTTAHYGGNTRPGEAPGTSNPEPARIELFMLDTSTTSEPPVHIVYYHDIDTNAVDVSSYVQFFNNLDDVPVKEVIREIALPMSGKGPSIDIGLEADDKGDEGLDIDGEGEEGADLDDEEREKMSEASFKEEFGFPFGLIKDAEVVYNINGVLFDASDLLAWQAGEKIEHDETGVPGSTVEDDYDGSTTRFRSRRLS